MSMIKEFSNSKWINFNLRFQIKENTIKWQISINNISPKTTRWVSNQKTCLLKSWTRWDSNKTFHTIPNRTHLTTGRIKYHSRIRCRVHIIQASTQYPTTTIRKEGCHLEVMPCQSRFNPLIITDYRIS